MISNLSCNLHIISHSHTPHPHHGRHHFQPSKVCRVDKMCCRQVGFPPQMLKSLSNKTSPSLTQKNKRQTQQAAGNNQPPTTSTKATSPTAAATTTSTTSTTTTTTKTRLTRARTINRSGALNKNVLHSILNNIYRLWTVYNDTENTESVDCAGRRVLPYQEVSYDLKT